MDAIDAREKIDINGDDDIDNNIPIEPRPTRREVLEVISTIGKYANDLNDPIARKMEAILGSFSWQLCLNETKSMQNAVLSYFFQKA